MTAPTSLVSRRGFVLWDGRLDVSAQVTAGFPTWRWRWAPSGLATKRQLCAAGWRPAGQEPYGRVVCRRGARFAWLYRVDLAAPKRPVTPAMAEALARAMKARRTCPTCGEDVGYCIPRVVLGECVDCSENRSTTPPAKEMAA